MKKSGFKSRLIELDDLISRYHDLIVHYPKADNLIDQLHDLIRARAKLVSKIGKKTV